MSKKSKSTSGPSKFAQPFIQQGANTLQDAYSQAAPAIQGQTDMVLGGLNPFLNDRLENGNAGVNSAQQYGLDVLAGNYLDSNPYFDEVVGNTLNDTVNSTQGALSLRGLTGGSSYADIISKNVGQQSAAMRSDQYNRERGNQEAAAGRAGSLASAEYLPVGGLLSTIQASQAPLNAASQYAGGLGGLLGGYQSQSQSPSALGIAAQLGSAALMASERRVKRDITPIDSLPDGLNIYNFRYVWDADDAPLHTGVMVDEVETLRPWALGPIVDGIQTVDYSKLEAA